MIEEWLYETLTNNVGVSAEIGNRLFPLHLPQGTDFPAAVYQRVGANRQKYLVGQNSRATSRLQIDCYAQNYQAVRHLSMAIVEGLHGHVDYISDLGTVTASIDNDQDVYEPETGIYRSIVDIMISHKEF